MVEVIKAMSAFSTVLLFCLLGGIVLCSLEEGAEKEAVADQADFARRLKGAVSADIFDEIVERGLVPLVDDLGGVSIDRYWNLSSSRSYAQMFLFAFTLSSTVGYGNISLRTEASKAFASIFSVIAIPAVMAAYTYTALRTLTLIDFLINAMSPRHGYEFAKYDVDRSGCISLQELRLALRELGMRETSDVELKEMMSNIDRDGEVDTLNYAEFCVFLKLTCPPEVEKRKRRRSLVVLVSVTCLWILFGSAMFVRFEGWSFSTAMWFCWISVSTIGLGDYVPSTAEGETFLVMWATAGLGWTALVITEFCKMILDPACTDESKDGPPRSSLTGSGTRKSGVGQALREDKITDDVAEEAKEASRSKLHVQQTERGDPELLIDPMELELEAIEGEYVGDVTRIPDAARLKEAMERVASVVASDPGLLVEESATTSPPYCSPTCEL